MKEPIYKLLVILIVSLLILGGLSFIPWSDISGGRLHDYNLLSDVLTSSPDSTEKEIPDDENEMDPELLKVMLNDSSRTETEEESAAVHTDSVGMESSPSISDSIQFQPIKEGELVVIEDYTIGQQGLRHLKVAVQSGALARIGIIGDSYIEGDIMVQNLREMLQDRFGGNGVGYMNFYSDFPGFRQSIRQGGTGWNVHDFKKGKKDYIGVMQHYFTPEGKASASYKGVNKLGHLDRWDKSRFIFISPENSVIKTKVAGDNDWVTHNIAGSSDVQEICLSSNTDRFEIETESPGIIGLGVWLEGNHGISVDCMSSRGFSGISLADIDESLTSKLSQYVPYDLIILEFGINAMSAKQKDYSVYGKRMDRVVQKIKKTYPSADILLMGVGDRGQKIGGEVHSMPTVRNMIDTQRNVAMRTNVLFWDTREAMGGEDAVVQWNRNGWVNKDYVHLSHKGGQKLAEPLFNAIVNNLNK